MKKAPSPSTTPTPEWNAASAAAYWPDQRGHWAPVSWKDHLFDFNVFYNGTVAADPVNIGLNHNVTPEQGIFASELRVVPAHSDPHRGDGGADPLGRPAGCDAMLALLQAPDGRQVASWAPGATPRYRLDHALLGAPIVLRQEQFAHLPGGRSVRRGDEPLFLWMRLEVVDRIAEICELEHLYVTLTLLGPSSLTGMGAFNNINFNFGYGIPAYPLPLVFEGDTDLRRPAFIRQAPPPYAHTGPFRHGLRNRLALPGRQKNATARFVRSAFFAAQNKFLAHLILKIPARIGARVDLVYPFLPVPDAVLEPELALGYDGALAEAESFWKRELATPTRIQVSEPLLQGWIDQLPRLSAMIAQKHPANGTYGLPSGSHHYEAIWPTPMALQAYALDSLGYGAEVDKYLEPFRLNQGRNKPPSPHLDLHPGYIGAPKELTGIDWITDHAAILWAAVNHARFSADPDFIRRWTPAIERAGQFTLDARRVRVRGCFPGILPPAVTNDCGWCLQTIWNNAWHHKALRAAGHFLVQAGRPAGRLFLREADAYRTAFQQAYRRVVAQSATWRAANGDRIPFTPPTLQKARGREAGHAFSLDCGALVLVFGELFPADDPLLDAALRWFREGPQWRIFRRFSSEWQSPVLDHELSSCEPCYSWNIFISLARGDRAAFTQGFYSLFAAGACRQNFVACETRDGVSGNCFTHGTALLLWRKTLVDEEGSDLHLLRMAPLAYFDAPGLEIRQLPTAFGPISLAAHWDPAAGRFRCRLIPPPRPGWKHLRLHLPPLPGLRDVTLNGQRHSPDLAEIVIPVGRAQPFLREAKGKIR